MAGNARANETQVQYHRRRVQELKQIRQPWESTWQALANFIEPTSLRLTDEREGAISRKNIVDSTATFALRTLASGMHSGLTSPARPWFRLTTFDPDLKDYEPVKMYLAQVEQRMREVFQNSNLYSSFHTGYGDLGLFGQSCGILVDDDENLIRLNQLKHGRFWIARDEAGRTTTMYRQFRWSVQRIVSRFGLKNVSYRIRQQWDQANYDETFLIWHAIEPRLSRDPSKVDRANKPFLSNYWEDTPERDDKLLEESGFDENPLIGPGWEIDGEDHYSLSPGQITLGDVKMLQKEQQRKLEGIDKLVRPPMTGPTSMRNQPASLLPGAITYVDQATTNGGFRPAMEVNLRLNELMLDIRDVQERIRQTFYADLFLMLSNMEGIQPRNQFEIAERKEEKLLALGPVLENVYNGQLEPVIDRTFAILNRRGELPPPPVELQNSELKIEYISILAQAQKAVSTGAVERLYAFAGSIAALKPDVMDKLDADQSIDVYADMLGADPSVVVSDDDVEKVREARAQAAAQAQAAETAATAAPALKQTAEAAGVMADVANQPGAGGLLSRLGLSG